MPRPDTGDSTPEDDDAALLAREYADVRPLPLDPREPLPPAPLDAEAARLRREAASLTGNTDYTTSGGSLAPIPPVAPDARLEFHRPGLQLRQWQKLRKGQTPWQIGVDLHGATRAEALAAVARLIRQAQDERIACVRVVHGKGQGGNGPTIKAELDYWLRRNEAVLAYCSALPADGGAGALYVLLRRARDGER